MDTCIIPNQRVRCNDLPERSEDHSNAGFGPKLATEIMDTDDDSGGRIGPSGRRHGLGLRMQAAVRSYGHGGTEVDAYGERPAPSGAAFAPLGGVSRGRARSAPPASIPIVIT